LIWEETVVFIDEYKATALEKAQVKQKEAAMQLRPGFEEGTS
jgi:hypothetical protein